MKFQMLRSIKFSRAIGTTPGMMTTKMGENMHRKTNITKVKWISTGNLGKNKDQKPWNKDQKKP